MASPVSPIPKGFHSVTPYLRIRGAAEAIEFYVRAFGAVECLRMIGPGGKAIMHAEIQIGDSIVMLGEEMTECNVLSPLSLNNTTVGLHIYVPDADAAMAKAEAAGAKVTMPVAEQFWGDRYGKVLDPFGHEWSFATHVVDLTEEEMAERQGDVRPDGELRFDSPGRLARGERLLHEPQRLAPFAGPPHAIPHAAVEAERPRVGGRNVQLDARRLPRAEISFGVFLQGSTQPASAKLRRR